MNADSPTITVSLSRKINLGNYESADVFVACSGILPDATEEDVRKLLDTGSLAYRMIRADLNEKIEKLKERQ